MKEEDKKRKLEELKKQYKLRDRAVKVISEDGAFRIVAIKNTNTTLTAQKRHNLPAAPAFILARALTASGMMASFLKGEERVVVGIESSGMVTKTLAESLQVGEHRGFVEYKPEAAELDFDSIEEVVGDGTLRVMKILYNRAKPLISAVPLAKGDVSTDIAYYYSQSEQIPTAVILDVDFDDKGFIKSSGGLLLQAMPGASEAEVKNACEVLMEKANIAKDLEKGYMPSDIIKQTLPFPTKELSSTQVDFYCRCSKKSFMDKLKTLSRDEIKEMRKVGQNELVCRYCGEKYYLKDKDFKKLLVETKAKRN